MFPKAKKFLETRGYVCIYDPIESKAVRVFRGKNGDKYYLKSRGFKEKELEPSYKRIFDIINDAGNEIITRLDYDNL